LEENPAPILRDPAARDRMTAAVAAVLDEAYTEDRFVERVREMLKLAQI